MSLLDILDRTYYGASVTRWLFAAAVLAAVYLALSLVRRVLVHRVDELAARTATGWDDLAVESIRRTRPFFLLVLSLEAAARLLPLRPGVAAVLRAVLVVATLLQAGLWGNGIVAFTAERYVALKTAGDAAARATVIALGHGARLVLWSLLAVMALDFFDVRITALLTGLGIGGVAVALAAQNVLGDLFAAMAIVLDRPFVVGDSIAVDGVQGDVEHIGLKTTRIRSVNGEQVIVANSDLLKSRVRNYGRITTRRVTLHLDIAYDTPPDALAKVPDWVREIVQTQPRTRFDRCHLLGFMESALRFEVVYHVDAPEHERFVDVQHAVNLELLRRFAAERIEFAYPSRTVFLRGDASPRAPARS